VASNADDGTQFLKVQYVADDSRIVGNHSGSAVIWVFLICLATTVLGVLPLAWQISAHFNHSRK
jgi:hypothetical protein